MTVIPTSAASFSRSRAVVAKPAFAWRFGTEAPHLSHNYAQHVSERLSWRLRVQLSDPGFRYALTGHLRQDIWRLRGWL